MVESGAAPPASAAVAAAVAALAEAKKLRAGDGTPLALDTVRDKNVAQLRRLNAAIFPIKYQDKYYTDAMAAGDYTRLAFYGDIYVGQVACRLEKHQGGELKLYIMTLGVLAPYRRLGIGRCLLEHVLRRCESSSEGAVREVYLHVQTNNEDAIAFYSRYGFEISGTIENYYKRLDPPNCHILSKRISTPKGSSSSSSSSGTSAGPKKAAQDTS